MVYGHDRTSRRELEFAFLEDHLNMPTLSEYELFRKSPYRLMSTPPLSQLPGAAVCSQVSRAGVGPGKFPWPSVSRMHCAVARCLCPTRVGMCRFGICVMTSLPGKQFGSPHSTPWVCQPMARPP